MQNITTYTGLDINDRNFPPNVSLRAELYDGAKLFYLSGLQYGCDAKNAFSTLNESGTHNVGLVLVKKCQHMRWVAGSFTHQNRTKLLYKRITGWGLGINPLNNLTGVITGWRSRIWLALLLSWAQRFKLSSGWLLHSTVKFSRHLLYTVYICIHNI